MLNRTVVTVAAAAFLGGAVSIQTAQARGYHDDDDIWDLMNPSWWYDEIFDDDDDDDWWYYRHRYNPYWRGTYGWYPPVYVIETEPGSGQQNTEIRPPE